MCLIKPVASKVSKGWYKTMVSDGGLITPTNKISNIPPTNHPIEMFDDAKNKFNTLVEEFI